MNRKGIAEVAILLYVIAGLALLFIPNPVSNAIGIGIRPNKTVQTDKVTLINDKDGNPIAYRQVTLNDDIQQRVSFWEWLRSLPGLVILLMLLGIIFPPVALFLGNLYRGLKGATKQIVVGVDKALDKVADEQIKKTMLDEMAKVQDTSAKKLVDEIQGKK